VHQNDFLEIKSNEAVCQSLGAPRPIQARTVSTSEAVNPAPLLGILVPHPTSIPVTLLMR
jgi:hypothetical protein